MVLSGTSPAVLLGRVPSCEAGMANVRPLRLTRHTCLAQMMDAEAGNRGGRGVTAVRGYARRQGRPRTRRARPVTVLVPVYGAAVRWSGRGSHGDHAVVRRSRGWVAGTRRARGVRPAVGVCAGVYAHAGAERHERASWDRGSVTTLRLCSAPLYALWSMLSQFRSGCEMTS